MLSKSNRSGKSRARSHPFPLGSPERLRPIQEAIVGVVGQSVLSDSRELPYASAIMFKPHPQCEARKRSASTLVKLLLEKRGPEILLCHYRELLDVLLWKTTEAECSHKHKTRYQSQNALDCSDKAKLRHDHVFQRSKMIAALEKAAPHEIDDILKRAVGCTVTVEEHTRLSKFDAEYGWERYRKAGIIVIDTQTDERTTTRRSSSRSKRT